MSTYPFVKRLDACCGNHLLLCFFYTDFRTTTVLSFSLLGGLSIVYRRTTPPYQAGHAIWKNKQEQINAMLSCSKYGGQPADSPHAVERASFRHERKFAQDTIPQIQINQPFMLIFWEVVHQPSLRGQA